MKKKVVTMLSLIMVFMLALGLSLNTVAAYAADLEYSDPYSDKGKRIRNHELLEQMTVFGDNSANNGIDACCGMVAMGNLMQFYNQIDTCSKGNYIPESWIDYKSNAPSSFTAQDRANNLRDVFIYFTPQLGGPIAEWICNLLSIDYSENASLPGTQKEGLNKISKLFLSGFKCKG